MSLRNAICTSFAVRLGPFSQTPTLSVAFTLTLSFSFGSSAPRGDCAGVSGQDYQDLQDEQDYAATSSEAIR
jgi:hypothetical protein